ncbi:MAG: T9SS type A sorting domain-containing protein [Saprospiraceae bacterium]
MKKISSILILLQLLHISLSATEFALIDFNNYPSAQYTSSGCFFTIDGVKMKLYSDFQGTSQICHAPQANDQVFVTKINRCDLPLSTSPGILSINASNGCVGVSIKVQFTDGTFDFSDNNLLIDESEKSIKEITITEIECGLAWLFGGQQDPGIPAVEVSFYKDNYSLTLPENEAKNQEVNLLFEWVGGNQTVYLLQIDTLQTFNNPVFQFNVTGGQKFVSGLKNNTTYYWRVKQITAYCPNAWSETWMFSTIAKLNIFRNVLESNSKYLYQSITSDEQQVYEYDMLADASISMTIQYNRGFIQIRDGAGKEISGEIISSIENGVINISYESPHIFEKNKVVYLDFKHRLDLTEPDLVVKLNIKPTPVVLLHGEYSSSAQSWESLYTALVDGGWSPDYIISPDYNNSVSFTESSNLVEGYIDQALYKIRTLNDDFGNKISLVGHGMGGLVIKNYLNNNSDQKNTSRIITINTPHFGTPMANLMTEYEIMNWVGRQCLAYAGVTDNNNGLADLNNGAMQSLRTDNPDLLALNGVGSNIPAHAMASQTDWACQSDFLETLAEATILAPLRAWVVGFEICENIYSYIVENELPTNQLFCALDYALLQESNDGFVGVSSQLGNLGGSAITNTLGYDYDFTHFKNPQQFLTVMSTKELLETDSEGSSFSKNGFRPAGIDTLGINPPQEDVILSDTIVEINIENLQDQDTICASLNSKISVTGNDSTNRLMIIYFYGNDTIMLDSIRYGTYDFTIPYLIDYEGDLKIGLVGSDGNGHFDYKTLDLFVRNCTNKSSSPERKLFCSVYPNPMKKSLQIEGAGENLHLIKLYLRSVTGQVFVEQELSSNQGTFRSEINSEALPPGIYYLTVYSDLDIYTKKVIKI